MSHVHGLVEATKRAFLVRDRYITDYDRLPHPPERYLATGLARCRSRQDRPPQGRAVATPRREGRHVWMGAADASGLVVSYIQSLYWEFGSGCVLPDTGVLMQNRGSSFSLDPKAVNPLEPGRRPFHTLNPALAVLRDGRVMAYGTMGGDGQPQSQAGAVHPACAVPPAAGSRHRPRRAGCWGAHGARRTPACGWSHDLRIGWSIS